MENSNKKPDFLVILIQSVIALWIIASIFFTIKSALPDGSKDCPSCGLKSSEFFECPICYTEICSLHDDPTEIYEAMLPYFEKHGYLLYDKHNYEDLISDVERIGYIVFEASDYEEIRWYLESHGYTVKRK